MSWYEDILRFFFFPFFILVTALKPVSALSYVSLSVRLVVFYCKTFCDVKQPWQAQTGSEQPQNPPQKLTLTFYRDLHVTDSGTGSKKKQGATSAPYKVALSCG